MYSKVSIKRGLYKKFRDAANQLGWSTRGHCWRLFDLMIDYALNHPNLFRKR